MALEWSLTTIKGMNINWKNSLEKFIMAVGIRGDVKNSLKPLLTQISLIS